MLRVLVCMLALLTGCSGGDESASGELRLPAPPDPWLAPSGVLRLGEPARLVVHDAGAGTEVQPLVLRNGAMQWNELAPAPARPPVEFGFVPDAGGHAVAATTIRTARADGDELLYAKTVFAVRGEPLRGSAALVTAAVGQPLELVPLADPNVLARGDQLPVRVRADDGVVADLEVRVDRRADGAWWTDAVLRSGERGLVDVTLSGTGSVRVTVFRPGTRERAQLVFEVGGAR